MMPSQLHASAEQADGQTSCQGGGREVHVGQELKPLGPDEDGSQALCQSEPSQQSTLSDRPGQRQVLTQP